MEKFLFVFKLSKGGKIIGWLKLIVNSLLASILILGLFISRSFDDSLRKIFDVDKESNFKFYFLAILLVLFLIVNAAFSFILIIGSINHQRMKVLYFLAFDCITSLLLIYWSFKSLFVIIALVIQLYLSVSVFSFWRQLDKVHKTRMENQEYRNRQERAQRTAPVTILVPAPVEVTDSSDVV